MKWLHLFDGFGVELEYMIVDRQTLDVKPIADELILAACGEYVSDVDRGQLAWSNELTLHVVELKTNGPADSLVGLPDLFAADVAAIDELLQPMHARLMPTAMHPWMNPEREMRLWPHEFNPVYETFNRIFDCRGHGWANLQSMHLNLPFADDEEFGRLHAAVRLILPLLPALAASSPLRDGGVTGLLDSRLEAYRHNARRIPSITGHVIPEQAFDYASYDRLIFQPMYADIAPYDPERVLQREFLNARGAIGRFDRGAIEIRVIDVQECPQADLAIAAATVAVLTDLVNERWTSTHEQRSLPIEPLENLLLAAIRDGEQTVLEDVPVLRQFGQTDPVTLRELWSRLVDEHSDREPRFRTVWGPTLEMLLEQGPLARRILRAVGEQPTQDRLKSVYAALCQSLLEGRLFLP
jgi:gamma-glutamyl:cysteine ligase YbdK (ATP-grasp superfamily)